MNRRQLLLGAAATALAPRLAVAQAARPLKIGVMNDMSSVYADHQGVGLGHRAPSSRSTIIPPRLGVPVEIVFADHQNKPDVGVDIARNWFDNDGVDVDHRRAEFGGRARRLGDRDPRKNKVVIGSGAGIVGADRARNARRTSSTGPTTPMRSATASAKR